MMRTFLKISGDGGLARPDFFRQQRLSRCSTPSMVSLAMICKRAQNTLIYVRLLCVLSGPVGAGIGSGAPGETNWYTHGGTHEESNYSALDQVNRRTISRLGLAWSLDLPGEVSLEATPLAIDSPCPRCIN